MKESEKKRERQGKLLGKIGQGRETEFLTYWKIPKSNMWLEQSRFKVTFMHEISRMTASLTITKLKLETESHAGEQTFRIKKDAVLTFHDHTLRLRIKGNHLRDDVFTLVTLFLSFLRVK